VRRFTLLGLAYATAFRSFWIWLIQFFGNIALFILFALWLWIPDARWWQLACGVLAALGLLCGTFVLHGGTLNYLRDRSTGEHACLEKTFWRAFRHVLAIAIWLFVAWLVWAQAGRLDALSDQFPTFLRSELPVWLRRHVTLNALDDAYAICEFVLQWIVAPALLLPFALQAANSGFRGFGKKGFAAWAGTIRRVEYWIAVTIAAVVGVWASNWDLSWRPTGPGATLNAESVSLGLRLFAAYLLIVASWITTCSMLGSCAVRVAEPGGKPAA